MIQVVCPECGVKLQVKDEFSGRKVKCPRCSTVVRMPGEKQHQEQASPTAPSGTGPESGDDRDFTGAIGSGSTFVRPTRLSVDSVYALITTDKLIAVWKTASGWQVKAGNSMSPARNNATAVPATGTFFLVELNTAQTESGRKLKRLTAYKLLGMDAAKKITGQPEAILMAITGPTTLIKGQKTLVLDVLKTSFMREIWGNAEKIRDFLTNFDAHSSEIIED